MRPAATRARVQSRTPSGLAAGAPRGGLRGLCSPATLAGGLTELAWVGAHVLMYPLGTRTEPLRPDPRIRPGDQPPGRAGPVRRRPAGRAHPGPARARPGRQPLGLHRDAPQPAPARLRRTSAPGTTARCCTDIARGAARPRRAHRAHLRADRSRPGARRRAQPRRPDRPLPRPAAGRRPPGRSPWSPSGRRTTARCWAHVLPDPAGPPAAPRVAAAPASWPSPPRLPDAGSPRSTATSTRWSCRPARAAATTPTSAPGTCSCAASGTCRCRCTAAWLDEVAATLAGVAARPGRPPPASAVA